MARKVLISFVGTGALDKDSTNKRQYLEATYRINGTDYRGAFIADVLTQHYDIDDIILIGTVKSMWEAVYEAFCKKKGRSFDEDYHIELGCHCADANRISPLELPQKEKLENALGGKSHVVLIKYGLTEDELEYNMSMILGIEKYLENGDELYVDITHAFRSLPMFLMNTLIHIQNVSKKNVSISHIHYGMLDVKGELGYAQVVDMKKILDVNDWISGAYSFKEFGNAYKISKLLNSEDKSASELLRDFSDSKNINNIDALQKHVQRLKSIKELPDIAQMTVAPVINDFVSRFGNSKSNSNYQYKLAKWHMDKHNYSVAYLVLTEAIITYVCEQCCYDDSNKSDRELAKDLLMNNSDYQGLKLIYNKVNGIRKTIAHAVAHDKSNATIIKTLKDAIKKLENTL